MSDYELYHHGVKGMKWGVRRKKTIVADSGHGTRRRPMDEKSHPEDEPWKENRKNYDLKRDLGTKIDKIRNKKANPVEIGKMINKGAQTAARIMGKVGMLYLHDQIFFGGVGTKIVKAGSKYVKDSVLNSMYDTAVLDKNGKVIHRYRS